MIPSRLTPGQVKGQKLLDEDVTHSFVNFLLSVEHWNKQSYAECRELAGKISYPVWKPIATILFGNT